MKKGDLCYLSDPDHQSEKLINQGHGYIWVYAHEAINQSMAYFTSLATGEGNLFYLIEMQLLNKEQPND